MKEDVVGATRDLKDIKSVQLAYVVVATVGCRLSSLCCRIFSYRSEAVWYT
jgi:hypothetical protein